jgi:hypothetical protein
MPIISQFRLERWPEGNFVVIVVDAGVLTIPQAEFQHIVNTLFPEPKTSTSRWDVGTYDDVASVRRGEMSDFTQPDWIEVK